MNLPAGEIRGRLAKQDSSVVSDEELEKLNSADLKLGGAKVVFSRMSGTPFFASGRLTG